MKTSMLQWKLLGNFIELLFLLFIIHNEVDKQTNKQKKLGKHTKCQEKINFPGGCRENKSEKSEEINKHILLNPLKKTKF